MRRLFVLMLVLLSLSAAAGAQAPRVIPKNDLFEDAKKLKFGKPVTIAGIEMAAMEAGEPEPSCAAGASNSIWFRLDIQYHATLALYTFGTQLLREGINPYHTYTDERVALAVYFGETVDDLFEVACAEPHAVDRFAPTQLVGAGISYSTAYLQVTVLNGADLLPPSYIRIQSQPYITDVVQNPGFADGLTGWKLKHGSGDALNDDDPNINNGQPAFVFRGNPGERSKLKQKIELSHIDFGSSATLEASVVYAHDFDDFEFVMTMKVVYKDGTSEKFRYDETRTFSDLNPNLGFLYWAPLKNGRVRSVTLSIPFTRTSGTLVVDDVTIGVRALSPERDASRSAAGDQEGMWSSAQR